MKIPRLLWVLVVVLLLCLAVTFACGDDDDDNPRDTGDESDDDQLIDDDVSGGDDDESDDDIAGDDDAAGTDDDAGGDDDTGDDDSSVDEYQPLECTEDVCTDPNTGLVWQRSGVHHCGWSGGDWEICNDLDLGGYDDWRGPTISELRSLIRGCPLTEAGGPCGVRDDCLADSCLNDACYGCEDNVNGYLPQELREMSSVYWSVAEVEGYMNYAWYVRYSDAKVSFYANHGYFLVRCVR